MSDKPDPSDSEIDRMYEDLIAERNSVTLRILERDHPGYRWEPCRCTPCIIKGAYMFHGIVGHSVEVQVFWHETLGKWYVDGEKDGRDFRIYYPDWKE